MKYQRELVNENGDIVWWVYCRRHYLAQRFLGEREQDFKKLKWYAGECDSCREWKRNLHTRKKKLTES